MERIKQALERARAERESKQPPFIRTKKERTTYSSRQSPPAEPINYSETRQIDIAQEHLKSQRIIAHQQHSKFAESYKILRTQILQRLNEHKWNVLAITSPGEGDGKTTTAVNLATSLAQEVGYTVLLIDANLRNPGVHLQLGITSDKGLSDFLLSDTPISELMVHPKGMEDLTLIPSGKTIHNSSEMLNSPKMSQLVEELKSRYPKRIIIFDLPPVLEASDAIAFIPHVDAALLVVADDETKKSDITRALDLMSATNIIGTVLNKSQAT
ncbi:MAG: CpsD/CapB family tyrosine-protein kinase [Gammaproteobacteria bacterium]